jgi:hypothetical protein
MRYNFLPVSCKTAFACILMLLLQDAAAQDKSVTIDWNKTTMVSKTTPTLQVVVNPMLRRGSPIHDGTFEALKNLGADYVRFVPWFPYPHMAVVELRAPTASKTFWDFSQIDPMVEDLMKATAGHSVVMNFSTIPEWMFKNEKPAQSPADPDSVFWSYNNGHELRDTTMKELTGYFARLFSWYTKGGFTDESGVYHKSGHFYNFPYWEVLNEPDLEHNISPQLYTKMYDAIVRELKKISPQTKFIGISVAFEKNPEWFEYFLNPANHAVDIPLEGISYHFYGTPDFNGQDLSCYQYSFFNKADAFLNRVTYIENIRKRLAPNTFTTINEIGNILGDQMGTSIPDAYWNLAGAMYAYLYVELTKMGIDVAGESQLVGYPTQFPDVSMMNWKTGNPNARFWVLKLLKDNFETGNKLVMTNSNSPDVLSQAFITNEGRKLLLINKRDKEIQLELPAEVSGADLYSVDTSAQDKEATKSIIVGNVVTLKPFAVAVIKLKN